jgi:hypothetical protein
MHHVFVSLLQGDAPERAFGSCHADAIDDARLIGELPAAVIESVPRKALAADDETLASPLPARATAEAEIHAFNFTDRPMLSDAWFNLYYPRVAPVEQTTFVRLVGGTDAVSRLP